MKHPSKMLAIAHPRIELRSFLELVILWHADGKVPSSQGEMQEFIDGDNFDDFLQAVYFWSNEFGLKTPHNIHIIRELYSLVI